MTFLRLTRITSDSTPVVTVEACKRNMRIAHDDDDELIGELIEEATDYISGPNGIGYVLGLSTWEYRLNRFPYGQAIDLPIWPIISIDRVTYRSEAGVDVVVSPLIYIPHINRNPAVVGLRENQFWPTLTNYELDTVTVHFTAGHADVGDIPVAIKRAIKIIVSNWYEYTEDVAGGRDRLAQVPFQSQHILERYRIGRFG